MGGEQSSEHNTEKSVEGQLGRKGWRAHRRSVAEGAGWLLLAIVLVVENQQLSGASSSSWLQCLVILPFFWFFGRGQFPIGDFFSAAATLKSGDGWWKDGKWVALICSSTTASVSAAALLVDFQTQWFEAQSTQARERSSTFDEYETKLGEFSDVNGQERLELLTGLFWKASTHDHFDHERDYLSARVNDELKKLDAVVLAKATEQVRLELRVKFNAEAANNRREMRRTAAGVQAVVMDLDLVPVVHHWRAALKAQLDAVTAEVECTSGVPAVAASATLNSTVLEVSCCSSRDCDKHGDLESDNPDAGVIDCCISREGGPSDPPGSFVELLRQQGQLDCQESLLAPLPNTPLCAVIDTEEEDKLQKDAEALRSLIALYDKSEYQSRPDDSARQSLVRACEHDVVEGCADLARLRLDQIGGEEWLKRLKQWCGLPRDYLSFLGVTTAREWIQGRTWSRSYYATTSSEQGRACYWYGRHLASGSSKLSSPTRTVHALEALWRGCKLGDRDSCGQVTSTAWRVLFETSAGMNSNDWKLEERALHLQLVAQLEVLCATSDATACQLLAQLEHQQVHCLYQKKFTPNSAPQGCLLHSDGLDSVSGRALNRYRQACKEGLHEACLNELRMMTLAHWARSFASVQVGLEQRLRPLLLQLGPWKSDEVPVLQVVQSVRLAIAEDTPCRELPYLDGYNSRRVVSRTGGGVFEETEGEWRCGKGPCEYDEEAIARCAPAGGAIGHRADKSLYCSPGEIDGEMSEQCNCTKAFGGCLQLESGHCSTECEAPTVENCRIEVGACP